MSVPSSVGGRKVYLGVEATVSGGSAFYLANYQFMEPAGHKSVPSPPDQSAVGGILRSTGAQGSSVGTAALSDSSDVIILVLTCMATTLPKFWARPADVSMVNAGGRLPGLTTPPRLG